jgi:hypothetical protein
MRRLRSVYIEVSTTEKIAFVGFERTSEEEAYLLDLLRLLLVARRRRLNGLMDRIQHHLPAPTLLTSVPDVF